MSTNPDKIALVNKQANVLNKEIKIYFRKLKYSWRVDSTMITNLIFINNENMCITHNRLKYIFDTKQTLLIYLKVSQTLASFYDNLEASSEKKTVCHMIKFTHEDTQLLI